MKQHLKKELKKMYEAPETKRKDLFLEQQGVSGISYGEFLRMQIPYIKKYSWVVNLLIFALVLICLQVVGAQAIWIISSFIPFLALVTVAEGNRSVQYKMAELELSARFSMRMVVAARMLMMGISNLIVLILCMIVVGSSQAQGFVYGSGAILIPYVLAAFANLLIARNVHGKESIYICLGVSVLIGGMNLMLHTLEYSVYEKLGNTGIILIFLAITTLTVREYFRFMKQMEEYVWN